MCQASCLGPVPVGPLALVEDEAPRGGSGRGRSRHIAAHRLRSVPCFRAVFRETSSAFELKSLARAHSFKADHKSQMGKPQVLNIVRRIRLLFIGMFTKLLF